MKTEMFRVAGPLCGEFTGHRWIPLTKASVAELWCFLWSAPEQTIEPTIVSPVIWDVIARTPYDVTVTDDKKDKPSRLM